VIAPGEIDGRDIQQVRAEELRGFTQCHFFAGIGVWSYALRSAGWPDSERAWTGSCPCQPFSVSGKRAGASDERHLWPVWFPLIRESQPVTVFGEQVASDDGLAWLDLVSSDLEGSGYTVGAVDTPACGFGAPHRRQRLYWVADARYAGLASVEVERESGSAKVDSIGARMRARSLAHAEHAERRSVNLNREDGRDGQDDGRKEAHSIIGACSEIRPLADSAESRRAGAREHDGRSPLLPTRPEQCKQTGNVADSDGRQPSNGGIQRSREHGLLAQGGGIDDLGDAARRGLGVCGSPSRDSGRVALTEQAGILGEPSKSGLERHSGDERDRHESGRDGASETRPASKTGTLNGFWSDAEWLWCRDEKFRPTKPGLFPLVNGAANRVGKLRGAGNALVAPQAEAFIRAYMELAR
jgi:DNA (cytosine-5)-methyltransferase 1